ncbi:MAG: hypothetical protein KDC53_21890 [Saprospiraceae bacterium]|nr:hypothetical protein [Saprospiraceae bacterium]
MKFITKSPAQNVVLIGLLFLCLSQHDVFCQENNAPDSFEVHLSTNRDLTLILVRDDAGIPQFYTSDIFTQVCETAECKPVRIILYWDLLGNYTHYQLPDGFILTKLDHVPFTPEDYHKFMTVLADPYSPLEDLSFSELTGSREKASVQEIDGITGATPKSISNGIVEGAVYTCYTIWHLAHGEISKRIMGLTDSLSTTSFILKNLIQTENSDSRRWAIKKILNHNDQYPDLVRDILTAFTPTQLFEAKFILTSIPDDVLKKSYAQRILWSQYATLSYNLQIILLERYQTIAIDVNLKEEIFKNSGELNFDQKALFNRLVFAEVD